MISGILDRPGGVWVVGGGKHIFYENHRSLEVEDPRVPKSSNFKQNKKPKTTTTAAKHGFIAKLKLPIIGRADDRSKLSGYLLHHDRLAKAWSWVSGVLLKGR